VVGVEAGFYLEDLHEAADEKAGSYQKDERQSDFTNDEQAAESIVSHAAGGTAAAFFEKFSQRLAAGGESGREAEEQAGEERDCQSEAEDAKVERDFLNAREFGRSGGDEEVDQNGGEGEAENAAGKREERAFGEKLGDDTKASRAECRADGNFAAAADGPGEEEIGDVGACD
jgi:hypothetical protein